MVSTLLLCSALAPGQAPVPMPQAPMAPIVLAQDAPMSLPPATAAPSTGTPYYYDGGAGNNTTSVLPSTPGDTYYDFGSTAESPGVGDPQTEGDLEDEEPTFLIERLMGNTAGGQRLLDNGWSIFGWVNFGYQGSTASGSNLPVAFDDRANEFLGYQNWLDINKGIDTSKNEFQLGGRLAIILPGTDARFTLPRGLNNDSQATDLYPIDPIYQYIEAFLPNLGGKGSTLKVGRFGTLIGYEVVDAAFTPFVSKSYNFQYNPFTHTGALLTTQLTDEFQIYNGAVTGSDIYYDPAAQFTYLGGFKYTPECGKGSIGFNTVITDPTYDAVEDVAHYNSYNIVAVRQLSDDLEYVLDATFSHGENFPDIPGTSYWYGFANYFNYALTDNVTSNWRIELFDDVQGARTGFEGLYFETTYGLSIAATDSIIFRPYVRYDYNGYSRPFEGDHHLFHGGFDMILRY